ncbi:hypothetical protein NX059_006157 [Plenodomus lindquistii]|nr:hypothetical protein NX059_006157 [Plenodomus lindquistii]
MFLLNYILAALSLLMIALPIHAKGFCDKCSYEGEARCKFVSLDYRGSQICRRGCWTNDLVCLASEVCRKLPTGLVHCITEAKACAGCSDFLDRCKNDYWKTCEHDCQVTCEKKTCAFDDGRCDWDCQMDICKK